MLLYNSKLAFLLTIVFRFSRFYANYKEFQEKLSSEEINAKYKDSCPNSRRVRRQTLYYETCRSKKKKRKKNRIGAAANENNYARKQIGSCAASRYVVRRCYIGHEGTLESTISMWEVAIILTKVVIKKEVLTKIEVDIESPLSFKLKGQNLWQDDKWAVMDWNLKSTFLISRDLSFRLVSQLPQTKHKHFVKRLGGINSTTMHSICLKGLNITWSLTVREVLVQLIGS